MKLGLSHEEESFAEEARTWVNEHLDEWFGGCLGTRCAGDIG